MTYKTTARFPGTVSVHRSVWPGSPVRDPESAAAKRLYEFRKAHPGVEIRREEGCWSAHWDSLSGRRHAYAAELDWVLDMLDEHFPKAAA